MNNTTWGEIFNTVTVRIALIGVLGILALFLLAETITLASGFGKSSLPATNTITVNGTGEATLTPDVARVSFTVEHTAATVAGTQAATTEQTNAAIDFVKQQGVIETDIKTMSYNISPQYAYYYPRPGTAPKVTGYMVSQSIQITVRDLAKVSELLAGLGKLGVQNVTGPDFALDDSSAGYTAARADAIDKAKAEAVRLAGQIGVRLGKIQYFNENTDSSGPHMYQSEMSVDTKSATQTPSVPVGQNTYNASVSITYEIY